MEVRLDTTLTKYSDFKICNGCGCFNFYDRESCHECGEVEFEGSKEAVIAAYEQELKFWMEEEGYTEKEADSVMIDV